MMSNEVKSVKVSRAPTPLSGQPEEANPYTEPWAYLIARGWRCQEGDPRHPNSMWIDPTKPAKETEEKVEISRHKDKQGKEHITYQVLIHPAVWPLGRHEAVAEQVRRDQEANQEKK
jgi:hypothetical protein